MLVSSSDEVHEAILVNLEELARQLRTTTKTLRSWLARWPDFPVLSRGTNGREYSFDVVDVFAFLRKRKEEEAASNAVRDLALSQLSFPFERDEDNVTANAAGISIKEQIEALKLRKLHREEAVAAGRLVEIAAVSEVLVESFQNLNRSLRQAVRQAGRELNLPDVVTRALDRHVADAQRAFVREAADLMKTKSNLDHDVGAQP